MKPMTIFLTLFCTSICLEAQIQPMFSTKIFFEDTTGNRDSIIVGFDTSANIDYNPQFGEVDISSPFDSVFDVRAVHSLDFGWGESDYILSKTIIGGSEKVVNLNNCYIGESIIFFIKAKHQPVKISWDKTAFNDTNCLSPSFLTPDRMYQMIEPTAWFEMPDIRYSCASKSIEFLLWLDEEHQAPYEIPYIAVQPVSGNSTDSIRGVAIHFTEDLYYSPCQFVTSNYEPAKEGRISVIFPNPTNANVIVQNISEITIKDITISDQIGRVILQNSTPVAPGNILKLNFENFQPGIYFVHQKLDNGKVYTDKFLKI